MSTHRRLYPFSEPFPSSSTSTSTSQSVTWSGVITTYQPNPFRGVDRWLFAFDEWGHRTFPRMWQRPPARWFCNWWDRRLT